MFLLSVLSVIFNSRPLGLFGFCHKSQISLLDFSAEEGYYVSVAHLYLSRLPPLVLPTPRAAFLFSFDVLQCQFILTGRS